MKHVAGDMSVAAPVLITTDVQAALERYRALGFMVSAHADGHEYGFLRRGEAWLHVSFAPDVDPSLNAVSAYLYCDDADALHAEWTASGAAGRHVAPMDTDYGLREGAYVDPDGNLLRYGSPLAHHA
jgi:catechol 2,3-dioxygenase-like lactoylglutathione lyase family enzyme